MSAPPPTSPVADPHLRTDHLRADLRGRAVRGGVVTAVAQFTRSGLYLLSTIALTRLLSPQDFGLVTMVMTVTGFLAVFKDAGLSTATVQRAEITQAQVSNLFWTNVALGLGLTAAIAALAPVIAWLFHDPRLVPITLALSLTFALGGTNVQHIALLNRQMRFVAIATVDIGANVTGMAIGVALAWAGWQHWALVGLQLGQAAAEVLFTWSVSRWRPGWPARGCGTRAMLNFGASLTAANFIRRLIQGLDTLLIGRYFGADAVGVYSRATALLMRPLDQFMNPFDAVFVPLLSRLQGEPARYRETFLQACRLIALLNFTLAGLLLGLAAPFVRVLLGPRWDAVAPLFAWFSLAALFVPLGYAAAWLLTTQGRTRDVLRAGVAFAALTVAAYLAGLPGGAKGITIAFVLMGLCVRMPVHFAIVGRTGPVRARDLWGVLGHYLPLWAVVALAAASARQALAAHPAAVQLAAGLPAGLLAGAALLGASPWHRARVREQGEFVRRLWRQRLARKGGNTAGAAAAAPM